MLQCSWCQIHIPPFHYVLNIIIITFPPNRTLNIVLPAGLSWLRSIARRRSGRRQQRLSGPARQQQRRLQRRLAQQAGQQQRLQLASRCRMPAQRQPMLPPTTASKHQRPPRLPQDWVGPRVRLLLQALATRRQRRQQEQVLVVREWTARP